MKKLGLLSAVAGAMVLAATPLSLRLSSTAAPSLSIDKADARVGRPLTPVSVAGVNRRQNRRAYGYGAGAVGVGVGAAAIGTAAAVAAAPYYASGYYGGNYSNSNASYQNSYPVQNGYPSQTNYSGQAPAFGTYCVPGTIVPMLDGQMHLCQ
jgi:hypothetical protein